MANKGFLLGSLGPYVYDPSKTYRGNTPIADYTPGVALMFIAKTSSVNAYIYHASAAFVTAGFAVNDVIEVRGSPTDDGYYLVNEIDETHIYLHPICDLTTEGGAVGGVTISQPTQTAFRGLDVVSGSSDETSISDNDNDTKIQTEESTDEDIIRFDAAGTQEAQIDSNGLTLKNGVSVTEFSSDGALSGDSDDAVPTEKAVKTYADTKLSNIVEDTTPQLGGDLDLNVKNIVSDTSTGTKIATASNQKIGFFNATPVVQQSHIADADGTLADITTKFNTLLGQIETLGLIASS